MPEQIAANIFSKNVRKKKVVRVPNLGVTTGTTSVPKPSTVSSKRKG